MKAKATIAAGAAVLLGVAGLTPALASKPRPKPLHGSWTFTDYTPDPSDDAPGHDAYCHGGHVPSSPLDVNKHTLKVAGKGMLTVTGHNTADWAMELRDPKGNVIATADGSTPQAQEGIASPLTKAGIYTVVYCNLTGSPNATADYKFKPRK